MVLDITAVAGLAERKDHQQLVIIVVTAGLAERKNHQQLAIIAGQVEQMNFHPSIIELVVVLALVKLQTFQ